MAHIFMPRIFEPPELYSGAVAVTITGTGDSTFAYAVVNGSKYSSPASGKSVTTGDVITFGVAGFGSSALGTVTINGTVVLSNGSETAQTYAWTVPAGVTAVTIALSYNAVYGTITVTTS